MTRLTSLPPAPASGHGAARKPSALDRIIAGGYMRYWIIGSWALALLTTVSWVPVLIWFAGTTSLGLVRTYVETRMAVDDPRRHARLRLAVATVSCAVWAGAPVLAFLEGRTYGLMMAVVLLMAGYTLVFTQMRSAPREALIVSTPYNATCLFIISSLWGTEGSRIVMAMIPVLGLALLIKVVITRMKDEELAAVNKRQAHLIDDLAHARDQAHAANDAKSSFLGVISHELRTPMNGVLGAAQLLEGMGLKPAQQKYVSIIRQSGESLLVQLNDILDLTKIEAGRLELSPVDTELAELCDRLIGPFRAQAEAKGLDFDVVSHGELPARLHVDALRIGQITHNLLSNAVKFTTEGGVLFEVGADRLDDGRARMTFSITDSGTGIAETDAARLFEPFTQVDASSTRRFGGTGLGLSISRRLARLMGGDVVLTSTIGEGSTFLLTIDVGVRSWEAVQTPDHPVAAINNSQTPLSVLIVEDHPVNRIVLEAWMTSMGHTCAMAENGQIALDQTSVQQFDLIVMDVNMPVMDGLTATRELRARSGPNQETPVVVLSASARPEDHAMGYDAGADAYVDKPVDFMVLARVVAVAPFGRAAVRALVVMRTAA